MFLQLSPLKLFMYMDDINVPSTFAAKAKYFPFMNLGKSRVAIFTQ